MAKKTFSDRINGLFRKSDWKTARKLLEDERENDPKSHWLLTQLGVTFYEQRRYRDSLQLFLASQRIKDDCPLTLWHLAGAYDAIGEHRKAIKTFSRLLQSKTSPEKDPCWESKQWTDKLKTNVVYRLGVCFQHLGENDLAEALVSTIPRSLAAGRRRNVFHRQRNKQNPWFAPCRWIPDSRRGVAKGGKVGDPDIRHAAQERPTENARELSQRKPVGRPAQRSKR